MTAAASTLRKWLMGNNEYTLPGLIANTLYSVSVHHSRD